ncbi:hypothetical protein [Porphyromonas gingivalis]|uniref:hypothetical protein n=1 Tax=Porphyromonas gingivalis TaxID=837 RepID=UPI003D15F9EF
MLHNNRAVAAKISERYVFLEKDGSPGLCPEGSSIRAFPPLRERKNSRWRAFPSPTFLRLKKCSRVDRKNVAREIFSFGARSEKFTNQNEKIQARIFPKNRTAISSFFVRDFFVSGYPSTEFHHLFP